MAGVVMHPCACGQIRVAPGTRTELGSVSHGLYTCWRCDEYGQPLGPPLDLPSDLSSIEAVETWLAS